jgi:exopolyphosphatase/guanosine-5'-triphosphate,3'-diphosphate pyrophosphatase
MFAIQSLFTTCCLALISTTAPLLPRPPETRVLPEQTAHTIERRAAFDIGSGQIKMQVSDVDVTANKIVNVLLTDHAHVGLREDIAKSLDGRLSSDIQNKTVDAIRELMNKCAPFHPDSYHAIATESFRLTKNNEELLERIKHETGLSVTIISQDDEGILGFISAVSVADVDLERAIAWDFGGGSTQITTRSNDHYCIYQGRFGSVPIKNALIKIQGKDAAMGSPNPISQSDMEQALQLIEESVKEVPNELRQKLNQSDVVVLGIGINPLWGLPQNTHYDKERMLAELTARLNLDDEAVGIKDSIQKEYTARRVSNLILVYGMMKALNIDEVHYVGTEGANAIGLLLSPQYWQTNSDE